MGYPTQQTISLFIKECKDNGFESMLDGIVSNPAHKESMRFLAAALNKLMQEKDVTECDGYCSGFLSCFKLFELQLEAESMDTDDCHVELTLAQSYIDYLESEIAQLKNNGNT